jgi:hypothetical protein
MTPVPFVVSSSVAKGGVVFQPNAKGDPIMLMGDSNGSMYGKVMTEIAKEINCRMIVISVDAGDPLPSSSGQGGRLWQDSLDLVKKEKPACVVLACNWTGKLAEDRARLVRAVESLKPHVGNLVLLTQPPTLPANATRSAIRNGVRPPFMENGEFRTRRLEINRYVKSLARGNVLVLDIGSHFESQNGEVLFSNKQGQQIYQDRGHLSDYGAQMIRPDLTAAITKSLAINNHDR